VAVCGIPNKQNRPQIKISLVLAKEKFTFNKKLIHEEIRFDTL